MKQLTAPVSPCLSPEQVWHALLTYLLNKDYGLTLDDTPFHDGNVIIEHVEAGVALVDAVNLLVNDMNCCVSTGMDSRGWNSHRF